MSSIFDSYSPYQLRQIFREKNWPEDFRNWINQEIATELLDSWLESVSEETYTDTVRNIIENMTFGYDDENGKEMLEFHP